MNIKIENYKNISKLDLNIQEGKVNCLFGISGCGKTSIAEGILQMDFEENCSLGKNTADINVLVDGANVDENKYRFFNIETQKDLIIEQNFTQDMYTVFFTDSKALDAERESLSELIKSLTDLLPEIYSYKSEVEKMKKEFIGNKLNADGTLPKTSKLSKLKEDVLKVDQNEESKKLIKEHDISYLAWKIDGTKINDSYLNGICPFCETSLDPGAIELIEKIKEITPKNFSIVLDSKVNFDQIKVEKPKDTTDMMEIDKFQQSLIDALMINADLERVISFIHQITSPNTNPEYIEPLNLEAKTLDTFKNLKLVIDEINALTLEIRTSLGKMKSEFNKALGKNVSRINSYIIKLGIPYQFKIETINPDEKTANFILFHKKDLKQNHRVKGLSFGEKNIIALILFLAIKDKKVLIIDDPVSSYDDFRRKTMLDLIYEFSLDRTIIVLSHDHVFLKYALFQHNNAQEKKNKKMSLSKTEERYFMQTGNMIFLENFDNDVSLKTINIRDFLPIQTHIQNHLQDINSDSFYRKVINLRLLAEFHKFYNDDESKLIYGFLSSLLHCEEKANILGLLTSKGSSEEGILLKIREIFGCDLGTEIPKDYSVEFNSDDLTLFEKAILKREDENEDNVKDELNNLVHFNSTLAIHLNPYKFNLFSKFVWDSIEQ